MLDEYNSKTERRPLNAIRDAAEPTGAGLDKGPKMPEVQHRHWSPHDCGVTTIAPFAASRGKPPAINLPPVTRYVLAGLGLVWLLMLLLPAQAEQVIVVYFAFIPAAYLAEGWPLWSLVVAPLSYAVLHSGIAHLVLNGVMIAITGQVLERQIGRKPFIALLVVGALGGAAAHALLSGSPRAPLVGASASVGALYGAGLILHRRGVLQGPHAQILVALAVLFIITNLIGMVLPWLGNIAYAAHLGGFLAGIVLASRWSFSRRW